MSATPVPPRLDWGAESLWLALEPLLPLSVILTAMANLILQLLTYLLILFLS